jgi:hypothetical protein
MTASAAEGLWINLWGRPVSGFHAVLARTAKSLMRPWL